MGENTLKIGNAIIWVAAYFGIMLFYTFLNIAVWRKVFPNYSEWINIMVILICAIGFICLLRSKYEINLLSDITPMGVFLAIQVCIIAPIIEEILMRGFVLGGLKNTYGVIGALFISALFFSILHFNMVQRGRF